MQKTTSERIRWHLETVLLVTVFGSLYIGTKAWKFVTGDKSPTPIVPFFGGGGPRRY